jgi:type I restriction enzyme S subunit
MAINTPNDWTKTTVGAIATVTSGGTPSRKVLEYWNGDIPWVTTGLIDFNTITKVEEHITQLGVENSSAKVFPKGTVLMAMFGQGVTRAKVALLGIDAAFNQACVAIVPKNGESNRFIYHNLAHRYEEIRRLSNAGSQENLNAALIKSIEILLPTRKEIDGIIAIADEWDTAINSCQMLIAAQLRFKAGLMQQLLSGKHRFENCKGEPWLEFHLGDLFEERNETNRADLPLLSITAERGVIPRDEIDRKDSSSEDKSLYKRIAPGDIGYNTMRMWQGVSAMSRLEGIVSPAYTICIPQSGIDAEFAAYLFKYPPIVHLFHRYSQGLVSDTLSLKFHEFASIKVSIPSIKEQRRIVSVLKCPDAEVGLLRRKLNSLKSQKRGLMQKLLSGEMRTKT